MSSSRAWCRYVCLPVSVANRSSFFFELSNQTHLIFLAEHQDHNGLARNLAYTLWTVCEPVKFSWRWFPLRPMPYQQRMAPPVVRETWLKVQSRAASVFAVVGSFHFLKWISPWWFRYLVSRFLIINPPLNDRFQHISNKRFKCL